MKNLILSVAILGTVAVSSSSQALVRLVAVCQTSDNMYRVSVYDNQGIGPVRSSSLSASVFNAQGEVLAGYAVKSNANLPKSASFGELEFTDVQTNGQKFFLGFGSTNYRHITFKAVLNNGAKVSEVDPACKTY